MLLNITPWLLIPGSLMLIALGLLALTGYLIVAGRRAVRDCCAQLEHTSLECRTVRMRVWAKVVVTLTFTAVAAFFAVLSASRQLGIMESASTMLTLMFIACCMLGIAMLNVAEALDKQERKLVAETAEIEQIEAAALDVPKRSE